MTLPRSLDPIECRILGSLMEKQRATPDHYPLTLNSLGSACNQRTSRDPVTDYTENEIESAIARLQSAKLLWKVHSGRVAKYEHNLNDILGFNAATRAVVTLLLLRGAQTSGEIRSRSERLHDFNSVAEVDEVLETLAHLDEPLVVQLPRQAGQKENRWVHLMSGEPDIEEPMTPTPTASRSGLEERLATVEEKVEELAKDLRALRDELGE